MKPKSKAFPPLTPEAIAMARKDAEAGISTKRIQARILIMLDQNATLEDIHKAVTDILKARRVMTMRSEKARSVPTYRTEYRSANLCVLRPDSIPKDPRLVNLWAVLTMPGGHGTSTTMQVMRSRFESRGERAYRIIPMGHGEPFTVWAESDVEWARKLLRFGMRVVWNMFEVEYGDYIKLETSDDEEPETQKEAA